MLRASRQAMSANFEMKGAIDPSLSCFDALSRGPMVASRPGRVFRKTMQTLYVVLPNACAGKKPSAGIGKDCMLSDAARVRYGTSRWSVRITVCDAVAGVGDVLAGGSIRVGWQAHLAVARVAEQPPAPTPTSFRCWLGRHGVASSREEDVCIALAVRESTQLGPETTSATMLLREAEQPRWLP